MTDKCAIHFFELPKLDKKIDAKNRKKLWMQLINSESEGDLIMLKQTNVEAIKDGADVIFRLSDDKEIKDIARRREDALRTEKSALYHAEARGIEKGRIEILNELRDMGISEDVLSKFTKQ